MSAVTEPAEHAEHADHADHDGHDHDGHDHGAHAIPDGYFIKVALILAVLTGLETSTYWVDLGPFATWALLIMMSIKFFMIVLVFMHLKFDSKLFGRMFYVGLGLAIFVYSVFLSTFQFFDR